MAGGKLGVAAPGSTAIPHVARVGLVIWLIGMGGLIKRKLPAVSSERLTASTARTLMALSL